MSIFKKNISKLFIKRLVHSIRYIQKYKFHLFSPLISPFMNRLIWYHDSWNFSRGILSRKVIETDMKYRYAWHIYKNTYVATWFVFCRHPVLVHIEWWFLYICLYLFSVLGTHNTLEQNLQKQHFIDKILKFFIGFKYNGFQH